MADDPLTPEDCNRLFAEYASAGDVDGLVSLYEPGGCLTEADGGVAVGHDAIRTALQSFAGGTVKLRMGVVKVLRAGDVAVLTNDWHATGRTPDGGPLEIAGRAIEVMRRQADGSWRYVVDDPYSDFS